MAEEGVSLQYTPTWSVALVCTVIVAISFLVERLLHRAGKYFLKKDQKPLYEALLKIKEELMLLGFISFILTISQHGINKICIPKDLTNTWLPCNHPPSPTPPAEKFFTSLLPMSRGGGRRSLFPREPDDDYCEEKDKAPLMSIKALHHLHILIFVLAVAHVVFCALTIVFGGAKLPAIKVPRCGSRKLGLRISWKNLKRSGGYYSGRSSSVRIRQWKAWEEDVRKEEDRLEIESQNTRITHVHDHEFVKKRFSGTGKKSTFLGWWKSFLKQFYDSVTKSDYTCLRFGFIMTHCPKHPKFDFHKYMTRVYEADFKKVVGISWYLWLFVVLFLLLNVSGWHAYFWISFIPALLLVSVGAKLEHVIMELAKEVAEKHVAIEGDLVVKPSDEHFWFNRPKIVLFLIHVILFQNAFEIAVFFWTWVQYGLDSCIMGKLVYVIPRLVIGVFVQFICSYSTLPLYALVTQMGSKIKLVALEAPIQQGLVRWAKNAKKNTGVRRSVPVGEGSSMAVQLAQMEESDIEDK